MTKQNIEAIPTENSKTKKKDYRRPELKTYGDIRAVTQGGGPSPIGDSGMNGMSPP